MATLEIQGIQQLDGTKNNQGPTLGELVKLDIRKAGVLKKYGLDFCCGGKKPLKQACEEKNIDLQKIEKELVDVCDSEKSKANFDFDRWKLDFLADYILNEHHQYWYDEEPMLTQLVNKVVDRHGSTNASLKTVGTLYNLLHQELNVHFNKEEKLLFPHIKRLVRAKATQSVPEASIIKDIDEPLRMMEAEHEAAGEILAELRKTTNGFTPPSGACNSFALMFHKLKCLEEDLHQHIHLENNILFPKAALLHKELFQITTV